MRTSLFNRGVSGACAVAVFASVLGVTPAAAQSAGRPASATPPSGAAAGGVEVPAEYVIGPEDVLGVNFWKDTEMTGDATVRPDGRITLPLIGDLTAAGLTPAQFKDVVQKAASKLITDPSVTIIVRTINSRKVFITGMVANPGAYPLVAPRTVMQLIALAGGLTEFADKKNVTIMRVENGETRSFKFNYSDVSKGKNLAQNIVLKPGDTVVVP